MPTRSATILLALLIAAPSAVEAKGRVPLRTRARLIKRGLRSSGSKLMRKVRAGRTSAGKRLRGAGQKLNPWSAKGKVARQKLKATLVKKIRGGGKATAKGLRTIGRALNPMSAKRRTARANVRNERASAREKAWNEYQKAVKKQSPEQAAAAYHKARKNTSVVKRMFSRRLAKMGKGTLKLARKAGEKSGGRGNLKNAVKFYDLTKGIKNGRGLTGGTKRRARRAMRKGIERKAVAMTKGSLN
ncbi:MAG: hypothetical protein JRH20_30815, partial [Deltaproteobacteria bacterium]|nr:hypothetical protein [Deltaproteobacteria bacterium]